MNALLNTRITYVWIFLALLTAVSWGVADGFVPVNPKESFILSTLLIVLAFFKVRLVIMHFMEIDHAPLPLRIVFEVWCVLVCCVIIGLIAQGTVT